MATLSDFGTDVPDEKPWQDASTLRELYHEESLNQSEVAERLDTTPSTISYWMNKLEIDTSHTQHSGSSPEELTDECEYYEVCGNETPNPANGLCVECMDLVRKRSADRLDCLLGDSLKEHIETLYERYT